MYLGSRWIHYLFECGRISRLRAGRLLIAPLILSLLFGLVLIAAAFRIGLFKKSITVYDSREDQETISADRIEVWMVEQDNGYRIYRGSFEDSSTPLTIKVPTGTYQAWVNWDGYLSSDGLLQSVNILEQNGVELLNEGTPERYLLLSLLNARGEPLSVNGLKLLDENGDPYDYQTLTDELWLITFDNAQTEASITVRLKGYEDVNTLVDLTQSRAPKLTIQYP